MQATNSERPVPGTDSTRSPTPAMTVLTQRDEESVPPDTSASEIHYALGDCSLGTILAARSERGICTILIGDDPGELVSTLRDQLPKARPLRDGPETCALLAQVTRLVEHPETGLDLPLDLQGTDFQRRVWSALRQTAAGSTLTYGELAVRIGEPRSARAVARACAANALAIAVPCHRVVRSDGRLAGYRWGVERKRALLQREAEAAAAAHPS